MSIEWWSGGWYIYFLDSPMDCRRGPFLTFQEAYDMFDLLKLQPN
jgi:hypothetical protein